MHRSRFRTAMAALVSIGAVVATVVVVMLGTSSNAPAVALAPVGHWFFDQSSRTARHVDAGTRQVDAAVPAPDAGDATLALQGSDSGYLVSGDRVTVFGQSSLTVESSFTIAGAGNEMPVGIETVGGPYLVYRGTGVVVRLGIPSATMPAGGPLRRPTYTDEGAVWLQRTDGPAVCRILPATDRLDCVADLPAGTSGDLAVVDDVVGVVDLAADTFTPVESRGLGRARPLGVDLPLDAKVADRAADDGMLPVVLTDPDRLVLLPLGRAAADRAARPLTVPLPAGDYAEPLATDGSTAVLDTAGGRLATFDGDIPLATLGIEPGTAPGRLSRGADGHAYLDDTRGSRTYVIDSATGAIDAVRADTAADVTTAAPADLALPLPPPTPITALPPAQTDSPHAPTEPDLRGGRGSDAPADLAGPVLAGPPLTAPEGDPGPEDAPPPAPPGIVGGLADPALVPAGPAAAPGGLTANLVAVTDARTVTVDLTWDEPDLQGATLSRYEVLVDGREAATSTSGATGTVTLDSACDQHRVDVRAVTSIAGGERTGEAVGVQAGPYWTDECLPDDRTVGADPAGGRSIAVTAAGTDRRHLEADCVVLLDGAQAWNGPCSTAAGGIIVDAPEFDTAYGVSVRATNSYGSRTGNTVAVRTAADPTAAPPPTAEPPPVAPPSYGETQTVYRVSSQTGSAESIPLPTGGWIEQQFVADVDVIDMIGAIVGEDPTRDTGSANTIEIQLIGDGVVLKSGMREIDNNRETRIQIPETAVRRGGTYTLRAINRSNDVLGFYVNLPGSTSSPPNIAPSGATARISEGSTSRAMSGIVEGRTQLN